MNMARFYALTFIIVIFIVLYILMLYVMTYTIKTIENTMSNIEPGPFKPAIESAKKLLVSVFTFLALVLPIAFLISFIVLLLEVFVVEGGRFKDFSPNVYSWVLE